MRATTRIALAFLAAFTAGCVKGAPFEPEMCVVTVVMADSLMVVTISAHTLHVCARPTIETQVKRP